MAVLTELYSTDRDRIGQWLKARQASPSPSELHALFDPAHHEIRLRGPAVLVDQHEINP